MDTIPPKDLSQNLTMGLGGVAGVGKTHLVATTGPDTKVLSLDIEGGSSTYNSKAFLSDPNACPNIETIQFDDEMTAQQFLHRIENVFDYLIQTKNKDNYTLVVVDSLTEMQERFLSLHNAPDKRQSYGAFRDGMHSVVSKARYAPVHVVFTSRLKVSEDEVLGREVVRFEISPGTWGVVSGLLGVVAYLDMEYRGLGKAAKPVRILRTEPSVRTQGKDRYGIGNIESPSMKDILAIVNGGN